MALKICTVSSSLLFDSSTITRFESIIPVIPVTVARMSFKIVSIFFVAMEDSLDRELMGISRTSVENTAQISTSTQDQVSGVQAILESMEKMQKGIKQLSEIVNAA